MKIYSPNFKNIFVYFLGLHFRPQKDRRRDFTRPYGDIIPSGFLGPKMEAENKSVQIFVFCFFGASSWSGLNYPGLPDWSQP